MVDLKAKPFYLKDEDIRWVEDTIASMTIEEKIGQLFVGMVGDRRPEALREFVSKYHPAAFRYMNASPEELWEQNRVLQEASRVPLLIASNCEAGGNGGVGGGTPLANGAAIAAADSEEIAYGVGKMGGAEGAAVGCNWNFAPVVDILMNWRNTVVQTRAYNDNPDDVVRYASAFLKGVSENGMATCVKHFPGDGPEENDQHLMMGLNDLPAKDWMDTFGKVYSALIDGGVQSIMAGHIAQPAWQRALSERPLRDDEILPATLCPELITGLLRGKLGFNGLVVTDASHMIGMFAAMPRAQQVPRAIAAGCDLFLFFNDPDEDFAAMLDGYKNGIITDQRLSDALTRVLGLKAAIGLHKRPRTPAKEGLGVVGCEAHIAASRAFADRYITLVKDTAGVLPLNPKEYKRLKLVFIQGEGMVIAGRLMGNPGEKVKAMLKAVLEEKGYEVDVEPANPGFGKGNTAAFAKKYDAVLVALDVTGFAQYNAMRMKWPTPADQPWYVSSAPTVFVSFAMTNHLIDLTMSKTYINCYMDHEAVLRAFADKLAGESPFAGRYNDNVWCGRWDTRL